MKYLLLFAIKLYWRVIPAGKRNRCIYKNTCSHYVFDQTKNEGLMVGLRSLNYRIKTCNPYFQLYKNPMTMETEIILSNGDTLTEDEIAERLIDRI